MTRAKRLPAMFTMHFDKLRTLLCLGAHADDIEIGCGGTVLRLLAEHPNVELFSCPLRADKAVGKRRRYEHIRSGPRGVAR